MSATVTNSNNSRIVVQEGTSKIESSGIFGNLGKGHRIFISGVNSLLGNSLFEELRNDHIAIHTGETPHKFLGTINQKEAELVPVPSSSIKILNSKTKPRTFKKQIASCDIYVLDLLSNNQDYEEAEYVIKMLKSESEDPSQQQQSKDRILILVSSAMTWINTPKKLKKNYPKSKPEDSDAEETKNKQVRHDESDSDAIDEKKRVPESEKVLYFTDQDFQMRVPPPRYQQIKNLEILAMSAQKAVKNLKVFVMCSGMPYGNGEANNVFYEFFRRAWLSLHQDLASLPIIGNGRNRIPTIHIVDLARSIKHLITNKNIKQQYLFAVDQAERQSQKKVMRAISSGMGSGLTKNVELSDVIDEEWCEFLSLDLKLKTSAVLSEADFWHCRKGISKSTMSLLNQEFNLYRGLFPLKLFITGPPASSKTHYATKLSQAYGVPHIKISDLVQMGYKLHDSLGDEIRKKTEEIKDQMVADYDKTKKKKDPELDRATIKVRLPDDILYKLIRLQLSTAACRNKGFILDGYPRSQNDAKNIFLRKIEDYQAPAEDEVDESVYPGYTVDAEILPQYVIVFQGEDLQLKARVKELPQDRTHDTHFNDQAMDRRLKIYREHNQHESGNSVQCFFQKLVGEANTKVVNALNEEKETLKSLQHFIEQNGKPCCLNLITEQDVRFLKSLERQKKKELQKQNNLHNHQQEDSKQQLEGDKSHKEQVTVDESDEDEDQIIKVIRREEEDQRKRQEEEKERKRIESLENEQKALKDQQDRAKLEIIRQQERDLLDTRSQPIRQYLMDNVVPHLTQGLIELCKNVPKEPGEFLAEFLLKKADEIDQKRIQEREQTLKAKMEAKAKRQLQM